MIVISRLMGLEENEMSECEDDLSCNNFNGLFEFEIFLNLLKPLKTEQRCINLAYSQNSHERRQKRILTFI
jgi:hypothetical protein